MRQIAGILAVISSLMTFTGMIMLFISLLRFDKKLINISSFFIFGGLGIIGSMLVISLLMDI